MKRRGAPGGGVVTRPQAPVLPGKRAGTRTPLRRLGAVMAGAAAVAWLGGSLSVRAGRLGPLAVRLAGKRAAPIDFGAPEGSDVRIVTDDGEALAGTYWTGCRPSAPAVLILHGMGAFRAPYAANAAWLAQHGYGVLTVDFRGHGQSPAGLCGLGLTEAADAGAAFAWLKRRQNGAPVVVVGISMGGAAALLGDEGPLPADGLVLQAVFGTLRRSVVNRLAWALTSVPARLLEPLVSGQAWLRLGVSPARLAPWRAVRAYTGPVLVIGGGADPFTPPAEILALYDAIPGWKACWIVPGVGHYDVSHLTTIDYRQRLLAFLKMVCSPAEKADGPPTKGRLDTSVASLSFTHEP